MGSGQGGGPRCGRVDVKPIQWSFAAAERESGFPFGGFVSVWHLRNMLDLQWELLISLRGEVRATPCPFRNWHAKKQISELDSYKIVSGRHRSQRLQCELLDLRGWVEKVDGPEMLLYWIQG